MSCECELAGYCERHKVKKNSTLLALCQQHGNYWQAWEDNRGPGQNRPPVAFNPKPPEAMAICETKWPTWAKLIATKSDIDDAGVGDTVKRSLGLSGVLFKAWMKLIGVPCNCSDRQDLWNAKYPYTKAAVQHLITLDDLTRDTLTLSQMILRDHPDVSGIAGVPRSGMRVACDIAIRLGVPLYEASFEGLRLSGGGGGSRIRREAFHGARKSFDGPIILVDDSICTGHSLRELRKATELSKVPTYVIYATKTGIGSVDGFVHELELPHWFEWNFFGNGQILNQQNVGIDFDGVLCADCLMEDDDDGERYTQWMASVSPIRMPRDYKVPFIITARCEAYRAITEVWLDRYRINYGELIMYPGTFVERQRTDLGQWKAEQCDRAGVGLFVESDYNQALRIAELRKRPVISIEKP